MSSFLTPSLRDKFRVIGLDTNMVQINDYDSDTMIFFNCINQSNTYLHVKVTEEGLIWRFTEKDENGYYDVLPNGQDLLTMAFIFNLQDYFNYVKSYN